jgi:DNA-directed RNA polymerase specialized sigma24 family protein
MADRLGRPTSSTLSLPPEVATIFRSVNEQLRGVAERINRAAAPLEKITPAFTPFTDFTARMPRPTIDLRAIDVPPEVSDKITQVCASLNAVVEHPPWSMNARSSEEGRALWDLLIAEWPSDTLVSEIARFIRTLDRFLTAESNTDLEAAACALARYDAFLTPYFKHRAVRRVLAAKARSLGDDAIHAWVADEVFTPILVDLIRKDEVYRPQRIRLGRTWVKVMGGWYRPTRESAPVFYRPGTIAQVEPMQLRLVQLYRWLRNRTHKLAEDSIISTELPAPTTAKSEIIGRSGPEPASDDGAYVLAACEPTVPERQTMDATARLETDETLHEYLASLSQRTRELVWLREVEGLPYREIARRLEYPTEVAARVARHRVRVARHRVLKRM